MKVLLTADIHIDDYLRYNPSHQYRLDQFIDLAHRYNEIASDEGCDEIWLAGDISNKPLPVPYVNHIIKDFLMIISKDHKVRFIRGQHDTFGKITQKDEFNSILNLFTEYAEYMNKKIIEIDGHKFGFMNWTKSQDLSWVEGRVDVMIGHLSHGFGQDWDHTKFMLGFFGDIHKEYQDGDLVSIGNPIQHRISDQPTGSVVILDTKSLDYHRVPIENEHHKYLKFKYSEEGLGYNPDEFTYYVKRPSKKLVNSESEINLSVSMDDNLIKSIESNGLMSIHEEVISNCNDYKPINLSFKVNYIKIYNTKGINYYESKFDENLIIVGSNGSGKSSFILSLFQLLTGSFKWKELQRRGTDAGKIVGEIEYEGKTIKIRRSDNPKLWVNGVEIPYKDKRKFNDLVKEYIPFIRHSKLFFFNSWDQELLGSLKQSQRMDILSRTQGLDIFHEYSRKASKLLDKTKSDLRSSKSKLEVYEDSIEELSNKISKLPIGEYDVSLANLLNTKCSLLRILLSNQSVSRSINELKDKIRLSSYNSKEDAQSFLDTYEDLKSKHKELESQLAIERSEGKSNQSKLNKMIADINWMESHPNICIHCHQVVNKSHYEEELAKLKSEKDRFELDYKDSLAIYRSHKSELESITMPTEDEVNEAKSFIDNSNKLATLELNQVYDEDVIIAFDPTEDGLKESKSIYDKLDELKSSSDMRSYLTEQLNKTQSSRSELKSKIRSLKDRVTQLESYCLLVSEEGPIYEELLNKVAKSLSNDMFKFKVKNHDLEVKFYRESDDTTRSYEDCSSGEKSLIDAYFLSKLLTNCGLMVFDEYFSHVDDDYLELVSNFLESMNSKIVISTHSNNLNIEGQVVNFNNLKL